MTNKHNQTIEGDELRRALQRGTDSAAAGSHILWSRILNAHANGGSPRRAGAKPWLALGATALAAAALVISLPHWLSVPDVVRPPVTATAQPSANTTINTLQSAAQQTPLATAAGSLLDGRFAQAADGDASLSQLYADVLAMAQAKDSNAPEAASQLMEVLLARKADLSGQLYAMTTGKNGNEVFTVLEKLQDKSALGDAPGLTADQKAFLNELFASGYTVAFTDGSPYAQIHYWDFKNQFATAMDDELAIYVSLSRTEWEHAYQTEGQLSIPISELAERYLYVRSYLDSYDEAAQNKPETHPWRTQDIAYLQRGYLSALYTLNGSLFAGEGRTVPQEYRKTYDTAIAESHNPMAATLLKEYRALLQVNDWTLNDDVRAFLSKQGVPEYGPAPRLIWAELSIYGVKLDSDGGTAIPKLTAAIGTEPTSDSTMDSTREDAGGTTRTVTWSNGTIATIRNGKVYSLETTAAHAPLVRGLAIGDPTETMTAYLGQPLRKDDVWTWGVGSNDNVFAWFTDNQLTRFKISLTE